MLDEHKKNKKLFAGTLLIIIGALLLARNLEILPFPVPAYVFSWKMILLIVGLFSLIVKRRIAGGIIMITIALLFLIPEIFGIPSLNLRQVWPAFIILLGITVLSKANRVSKKKHLDFKPADTQKVHSMEATAIFGGESKKISSYDFTGGKATAVFGGLELDLTNCYLSNERAEIDVTAFCGGISLRVPKEWNVRCEVLPVMGGIEDKITQMHSTYVDPAAELVLKGVVVMGGIEIIRD